MKNIRRCDCGHENPADEIFCEKCTADISKLHPLTVSEDSCEAAEKTTKQADQETFSARICPDCGAELDSQPHYPRCKRLAEGFSVVWQNSPLQPIRITKDRPLFIGRVPPVNEELIVHFEETHKTVSRNHAEVYVGKDGNPYLRDMNSVNGSFVNNQQVHPFVRTMLQVGDIISFSHTLSAIIK